jgi:competence protein ComEC
MLRWAGAALAGAWLVQQLPVLPGSTWLACGMSLAAISAWSLGGGRAAAVVMLTGWAVVRAEWVLEDRWPEALAGADVLVRGTVCAFPRSDRDAVRFTLVADADPLLSALPRRLYLSWYDTAPEIAPGQRWQVVVRLKPPRGLQNPGAFDFERWLYVRRVGATGYVRRSSLNRALPGGAVVCPVGALRATLADRISSILRGQRAAAFVPGIVVGATHGLQPADWELLRRTGTTHLMAISGLNIAMVAVPFLLLGRIAGRLWPALNVRFPAGPGLAPALLAAASYSALAGFEVSTVRALVMLLVAAAFAMRGRGMAPLNLLGAAAVAILVVDPFAVLAAGFWLSFAGVGWLLLAAAGLRRCAPIAHEPEARWSTVAGQVVTFGRVQLMLGVGLAPLTVAWFAQVSVIAPLTNLVAVPLFTFIIMPLALAGTVLLPFAAGAMLLHLAADVLGWLLTTLEQVVSWPITTWQAPPVGIIGLGLAAFAVLMLCWPRPVPLRWVGGLALLPLVTGTHEARAPAGMRVVVMDVGQGLAVLVQTAQHTLLYDAGPAFGTRDAGSSIVLPVLRELGVRDLDVFVVSHADADHAGGAAAVLQEFPDTLLVATAPGGLSARSYARCIAGLGWSWDGFQFRIVAPKAREHARLSDNDSSCVLLIRGPATGILLPGDIGEQRERELVHRGVIPAVDLVVAPHHGSRTSSGLRLVSATRPRLVVMSAGYRNRWNFPAAEVSERWRRAGACILAIANTGALIIEFSGSVGPHVHRRQRIDGAHLWTLPSLDSDNCRTTNMSGQ